MEHISSSSVLMMLIYCTKIWILYEDTETLLVAITEVGLEINALYMFISHHQKQDKTDEIMANKSF